MFKWNKKEKPVYAALIENQNYCLAKKRREKQKTETIMKDEQ